MRENAVSCTLSIRCSEVECSGGKEVVGDKETFDTLQMCRENDAEPIGFCWEGMRMAQIMPRFCCLFCDSHLFCLCSCLFFSFFVHCCAVHCSRSVRIAPNCCIVNCVHNPSPSRLPKDANCKTHFAIQRAGAIRAIRGHRVSGNISHRRKATCDNRIRD